MLSDLKRAVVLRPDDPEARFALGEALFTDGLHEESAAQLERCLELAPAHGNARRMLARAYVATDRLTAAEKLLVPAAEAGDAAACDVLGELYRGLGRPDDALLWLVAGTRLDPGRVERRVAVAAGLLAFGLLERAREHLEAATKLAPEHPGVREMRRELATLEGDLVGATVPALERAKDFLFGRSLSDLPPEARPMTKVTDALRAGDVLAAKRALVTTSDRGPGFAWLRAEVALLAADLDLAARLFAELAAAPALRPELAVRARLRGAEIAVHRGDARAARLSLEAAPQGTALDHDLLDALGDACAAAGDARAAEDAYGRAAKIDPSSPAGAKAAALRAKRKHASGSARRTGTIGVLGWNERGGRVSPVEAVAVPGKGELVFTGNVGPSGREAANVAFSCAKARAKELGYEARLGTVDVHVHFSDTEFQKDGASSGLALTLAIVSALKDEELVPRLATTGEITTLGVVRPIAGLREKLVAACLAGMALVLVPRRNLLDLRTLPAEVRRRTTVHGVDTLAEALELAFGIPPSTETR